MADFSQRVKNKFGKDYSVNTETYTMGVQYFLADHIAKRFYGYKNVLDACAGAGFMTLAIAKQVDHVVAVDINLTHLNQAEQNAKLDNISNKITFVLGDILKILPSIGDIDAAFLDPDWSSVSDLKTVHVTKLSEMIPPGDKLLESVFKKTKNVCLRLPKEFDLNQLTDLPQHELEPIYLNGKLKFYCVYFGQLAFYNKKIAGSL